MKRIPAILMTVVMLLCAAAGAFADAGADIKVGEYITFGRYPQTSAGTDETPIEWLVLARDGKKALLISRYGLDAQPYNKEYTSITWETCSLRKWLNTIFLNTAFSEKEQSMIPIVTVSADRNPENKINPGNPTEDQVFLLSIPEAKKYFRDSKDLICQGTAYCYVQGGYKARNGNLQII